MDKICILGLGSWGSALGLVLSNKNYDVCMWTLNEEQSDKLNNNHINEDYLPNIVFPNNMKATTSLEDAIKGSSVVILATPSQAIRSVCEKIQEFVTENQILVNVSKGLEESSGLRLSQVVKEVLPNNKFVSLSGPSHAEEVAVNMPTTLVSASTDLESARYIQDLFMTPSLRIYTNDDLVGVELGGALKNIIAFAAGVCDGIGLGDNSKAALITRGIREITRLGVAMGAKESTFSGLSGIGDLIVTCTSMHSRNRRAGMLIGQGKSLDETLDEIKMVVEGIVATKAAYKVSKELNVEMPITEAIYKGLYENENPKKIIDNLMNREKREEII
ncbi:MAG: NAD(P)H-dependent glycerol-3-phosphate dehydrogenase, partial [Peptostreptococcaceae bacterium]